MHFVRRYRSEGLLHEKGGDETRNELVDTDNMKAEE
jgi:hypothetical protein